MAIQAARLVSTPAPSQSTAALTNHACPQQMESLIPYSPVEAIIAGYCWLGVWLQFPLCLIYMMKICSRIRGNQNGRSCSGAHRSIIVIRVPGL